MNHRLLTLALAAAFTASAAFADEGLATEGKSIDTFNFRLPVYNPQPVGSTVVGLDKFAGPDASDKKTKLVLLSFMASFCAPCKKEMPYLQSLHEGFADQGLRVVMVSIDTEPDGQKKIDELIAENKVTFPVLRDRFNLAARRWLGSKTPLPSVFLIKPDGVIQTVHRGYNDEASHLFASAIEGALGLKAGDVAQKVAALRPPPAPEKKEEAPPAETVKAPEPKKTGKKKKGGVASTTAP